MCPHISRQALIDYTLVVNANAQPAWPPQSEGPVTGPLDANELAGNDDMGAPLPSNPWLLTFDQTPGMDNEFEVISDCDL